MSIERPRSGLEDSQPEKEEKPRSGGVDRRRFLSWMGLGAAALVAGPKARAVAEALLDNQSEARESMESLPAEFAKICAFYLDTAKSPDLDRSSPESIRAYLQKTLNRYLEMERLVADLIVAEELPASGEGSRDAPGPTYEEEIFARYIPADLIVSMATEDPTVKLSAEIGRRSENLPKLDATSEHDQQLAKILEKLQGRFAFVVQAQEVVKEKLREAGLEGNALDDFEVDGRMGTTTTALCAELFNGMLRTLPDILGHSDKHADRLLEVLRSGKLDLAKYRYEEGEREKALAIYQKLKEQYPIDQSVRESPEAIKSRFLKTEEALRENLAAAGSNPIMRRAVQVAIFNYYMDLWDGAPATNSGGNARYPYEAGKWHDCTTFIYQAIARLFPDLPAKIQLGGSAAQIKDYARHFGTDPIQLTSKNLAENPGIYIVDAHSHVFLVGPSLEEGTFLKRFEASGDSKKVRRVFFVASSAEGASYEGVSISETASLEKMARLHSGS